MTILRSLRAHSLRSCCLKTESPKLPLTLMSSVNKTHPRQSVIVANAQFDRIVQENDANNNVRLSTTPAWLAAEGRRNRKKTNEHFYNKNFPDLPWWLLTSYRFMQTLNIILYTYLLCSNHTILTYLRTAHFWTILLTLVIHILFWAIEEDYLRTLKTTSKTRIEWGIAIVSTIYAICISYTLAFFYAHFDLAAIAIGAAVLLLYWIYHVHWSIKSARDIRLALQKIREVNAVINLSFDDPTRPETIDNRMNIGPQLVFPKPEEYSIMPC